MDPRDALNQTMKAFRLKAKELAQSAGITEHMLSRYRNKRQDMNSLNAFDVIRALPVEAQDYFMQCLRDEIPLKQNRAANKEIASEEEAIQEVLPKALSEFLAQLRADLDRMQERQGIAVHGAYSSQSPASRLGIVKLIDELKQKKPATETEKVIRQLENPQSARPVTETERAIQQIQDPQSARPTSKTEKIIRQLENPQSVRPVTKTERAIQQFRDFIDENQEGVENYPEKEDGQTDGELEGEGKAV
jgi:transcriptional regulator with XRE-family HTH domain